METLTVHLEERSYPIYIGTRLFEDNTLLERQIRGRSVMVVSNDTVGSRYMPALMSALPSLRADCVILPDGEQFKTLETLNTIFTALLEKRHDRGTTLIALGGGVIGDVTGFAAASYQRGVDFIQVPTTLLAQVDSSVGGKTGVNHALGKNMIGAFHQPRCVIIDTDTLTTLPDKELSAGLAEVIKYGLIGDLPFFTWLEANLERLMQREPAALAYCIRRSCENKAAIVAQDEREQSGRRALLNLGHTFGHAIETALGYGTWLHGEAVGCGMVMAARLSHRLGWLSADDLQRAQNLIERARLPTQPPAAIKSERFLELMASDKKSIGGKLRLVLLRGLGCAVVTPDFSFDELKSMLEDYDREPQSVEQLNQQ
ncbi:MAG: 3-dehydroquinate synthase [Gammaproteobacteria bacterium]